MPFVLTNPLVTDIRTTAFERNFSEPQSHSANAPLGDAYTNCSVADANVNVNVSFANFSATVLGNCSWTDAPARRFSTITGWFGALPASDIGIWIDSMLLLIFGGIPWQVYFQRVLSCKSAARAKTMSHIAAGGCFFLCIAPILIGASAASTGKFTACRLFSLSNSLVTDVVSAW